MRQGGDQFRFEPVCFAKGLRHVQFITQAVVLNRQGDYICDPLQENQIILGETGRLLQIQEDQDADGLLSRTERHHNRTQISVS